MTPYYKRLSTPVDVIFPSCRTGGGAGYENPIICTLTQNLKLVQILSSITTIQTSTTAYGEEKNDK